MYNFSRKFKIDYIRLKEYLESLNEKDFRCTGGGIRKGTSIGDVLRFKKDTTKIPFSDVILYGQPFLVDLLGNDLSIAILSNRKYKIPNGGRSVKAKFHNTIIEDCTRQYGTPLNGYWIIPDEFISY